MTLACAAESLVPRLIIATVKRAHAMRCRIARIYPGGTLLHASATSEATLAMPGVFAALLVSAPILRRAVLYQTGRASMASHAIRKLVCVAMVGRRVLHLPTVMPRHRSIFVQLNRSAQKPSRTE
jgi:hypothetical protein